MAVLAVVLYHADVGWLAGGFVGVDVFYVISGFLITDHLWREVARDGRLSFGGFYARRARRLLPAAIVVLIATMAAAAAVLPPLQIRSVWKDGLYCALYAGNFRFAATRTDYLANAAPSPFQHFWSLGVEEQFYLVWPLLLIVVSLAWWRHRPSRATAIASLTGVSALSLLLSAVLTSSDQPVAFFLLPTRAWELGLGGLAALAAPELRRLPGMMAAALGWTGLLAIVVACVAYGPRTPYPGTAALLPVLGSLAVVVAGLADPATGPVLVLRRAAMRAMGRISYSWYLWHYPVLVLIPVAAGHPLSVWAMVGLALGSGLLAVLTFRFVEEPARRSSWMMANARRSVTTGLALSGAGVLACVGAALTIPSVQGHGQAPVARIRLPPSTAAGPATAVSPQLTAFQQAQQQVVTAVAGSAPVKNVPANLQPPLTSASRSEAAPMVDGCLLSYTAANVDKGCLFGDTTSTRSIVLFGDSHASMWFPAVDSWANSHGYRLYVWTKAACPPVHISLFSPVLDRTWTECRTWYGNVMAQMAALRPTLVVLGIAPNYDAAYEVVQNGTEWLSGLSATVTTLRSTGIHALVIGAAPSPPQSIPDCLSAHLGDVPACEFSPAGIRVSGGGLVGLDQPGDTAEQAAVKRAGGTYVDVRPWFCTTATCDVIVDDLLVYRDNSHITVPYADYLAPLIADEIGMALGS